ncbi:MAG: SusC/RagA family TonB-linked outer membrane protein, partial [Bacteroidales bacterium]
AQRAITGKVIDDQGLGVAGASVVQKGTVKGTITDADGNYSLTVPEGVVLQISFMGMKTQEVTVGTQSVIDITMKPDAIGVDEVTVVAFGKQQKESVIASITTVRPAELKVPSSNLTTALAGKMAGIISYQRSGEPGEDNAEFFIRGITTFGSGKKDPLILVDNVELNSDDLSKLNPDDIESFSILKDASATALYGARGANGVILITTKGGVEGRAQLSVRFENSFSAPTQTMDLVNPLDYMTYHNEAVRTRDPLGALPYSNSKIENTINGTNRYVYPATDWVNLLTKDYTSNQRLNLNLKGGGKVARYYIAGAFSQDNGILEVDNRNNFNNNIDLKKYLLRSNVDIDVTKSTKVVIRMHGTFDDYTGPIEGGSELFRKSLRANPVLFPPYYPADEANEYTEHILFGNFGQEGNYLNPYADMVKGYRESSNTVLLAQLELEQDLDFILKGLRARILGNTVRRSGFSLSRAYAPFFYAVGNYDKEDDTYKLSPINPNGGREYLDYNEGNKTVSSSQYLEASLSYNKKIQEVYSVSGMMVMTARESLSGNAGDLQSSLPFRNLGLAGRFTFGYDSRYFIEANFGYNGSERFNKKHRFGFFPSAGLGWVVSNEPFYNEAWKRVVSNLKLKGTYGLVGNDQIGAASDRFFYLSNVNLDNGGRGYQFGSNFNYSRPGVSISRYADPNISWETAYKTNIGVEMGLFQKVNIQAEYFTETRKNILQTRADIPSSMGLQAIPSANIGEASAEGVDISVDYNHYLTQDLWITMRGNFTYADNRFKFYEEPDYSATPWRSRIGQNISQRWGYVAERLFVDEEDVRNSPQQFGDYMAGDIKYKDINKDGSIDDRDMVPIGHPTNPKIIYGFGASIGNDRFDFSFFFQGSAMSSFWIDYAAMTPFSDTQSGAIGNNAMAQFIEQSHWSEEHRDIYATWPRLSTYAIENNKKSSTWFMRNGAFLRLKSAELGFKLPKRWMDPIGFSLCRIYASGTNLLTFSRFKLWDPEMGGSGLGYPIQRVINVGIQFSL